MAPFEHFVDQELSIDSVKSLLKVNAQEVDELPVLGYWFVDSLLASYVLGPSEEGAHVVDVGEGRLFLPKASLIRV